LEKAPQEAKSGANAEMAFACISWGDVSLADAGAPGLHTSSTRRDLLSRCCCKCFGLGI